MIKTLVSTLPEIYQPIYGHPEFVGLASRPSRDRLEHVLRVYDALTALLGRPLRVLDLGCAQGYFSFNLAVRGAEVQGIDLLPQNIALCNELSKEHPHLNIQFKQASLEDELARLEDAQYDIVLGLSVFHHVIHARGTAKTGELLTRLSSRCAALIVEVALHNEPLYWAAAQPLEPRSLLEPFAFIHELARIETHLSTIVRPLYVASNKYWILNGQAGKFDTCSTNSHALAQGVHRGSRRYFFSADTIVKHYLFDHPSREHNQLEYERAVHYLKNPSVGESIQVYKMSKLSDSEGWLVMRRLPGRLLLDLLQEGAPFDPYTVLVGVLEQLAEQEKAGWYHNDLRIWNVLVEEDATVHLIDYDALSTKPLDCSWPHNLFLSFFIFVHDVTTRTVRYPSPLRTVSISPFHLPQPYKAWASALWASPLSEWSFQRMHQLMLELPSGLQDAPPQSPSDLWMEAIEDACQTQNLFVAELQNSLRQTERQLAQLETDLRAREEELRAIHASNSWRLSSALRGLTQWVRSRFPIVV